MITTTCRLAKFRRLLGLFTLFFGWVIPAAGDVYDVLEVERPAIADTFMWVLGRPVEEAIGSPSEGTRFRTSGLPPGVQLDEESGQISGTPLEAGRWTAYFEVSRDGKIVRLQSRQVRVLYPHEASSSIEGFAFIEEGHGERFINLRNVPGRVSFPDGLPNHLVYDGVSRRITGNFHTPGLFEFTMRIEDPLHGTGDHRFAYYVRPQSDPEGSVKLADYPDSRDEDAPFIEVYHQTFGDPFHYQIRAEGPVQRFRAASLPPGVDFDESSGLISGTPEKAGVYDIVIAVEGETGVSLPARLALAVTDPSVPDGELPIVPEIQQQPWISAFATQGAVIDLARLLGAPAVPSFGGLSGHLAANRYQWHIDPAEPGIYPIEVTIANAHRVWRHVIHVLMVDPNEPITLSAGDAKQNASVGEPLRIPVRAQLGDPEDFKAFGLPPGLSIDSQTGLISGTPEASGDFRFVVTAESELEPMARSAGVTLSVRPPPAPVIGADESYNEVVVHGQNNFRYDYPTGWNPSDFEHLLPPGLHWEVSINYAEVAGHAREEGVFPLELPAGNGGLWKVLYAVPPQLKSEGVPLPRLEGHIKHALRLVAVDSVDEIVDQGDSLVVVALVRAGLRFRAFDSEGRMTIDVPESAIPPFKENALARARQVLDPFPDEETLTDAERNEIISRVGALFNIFNAEAAARKDGRIALFEEETVLFSLDDGETWREQVTGHLVGRPTQAIYAMNHFAWVGEGLAQAPANLGFHAERVVPHFWATGIATGTIDEQTHVVAVGSGEQASIYATTDFVTWSSPDPAPPTDFVDIAFGAGRFVAVSGSNVVWYSDDGVNWSSTFVTVSTEEGVTTIAYGNGRFLASGSGLWMSENGRSWEKLHDFAFEKLAFADRFFMATDRGFSEEKWISVDGTDWGTVQLGGPWFRLLPTQENWYARSNGLPLVRLTDLRPTHWVIGVNERPVETLDTPFSVQIETRSSPTRFRGWNLPAGVSLNESTGVLSGSIAEPERYKFLLGVGEIDGSFDYEVAALHFRAAESAGNAVETGREGEPLIGRASLGGTRTPFSYRLSDLGLNPDHVIRIDGLPDGVTWTPPDEALSGTASSEGLYHAEIHLANGQVHDWWIGIGDPLEPEFEIASILRWPDGSLHGVGRDYGYYTYGDGAWKRGTHPSGVQELMGWASSDDTVIALGTSGRFAYADPPAFEWRSASIPNAAELFGVGREGKVWYAVERRGNLRIANEGTGGFWSNRSGQYRALATGAGRQVIGDNRGGISVLEAEGDSFAARLGSQQLSAIAYDGSHFVCVGDNGLIARSPDGLRWETLQNGTGALLMRVQGRDGVWVADGPRTSYLSVDGAATWHEAVREPSNLPTLDRFSAISAEVTVGPDDGIYFHGRGQPATAIVDLADVSLILGQPFTANVLQVGRAAIYEISGLPPGLTSDGRRISGTPEATGTYRVLLEAGGFFDKDYEVVTMVVQSGEKPVQTVPAEFLVAPGEPFAFAVRLGNRTRFWQVEGLPSTYHAEFEEVPPDRLVMQGMVRGVGGAPGDRVVLESVATNAFGSSRKTITIATRGDSPQALVRQHPSGGVVEPGEAVSMSVDVEGLPGDAEMQWFRNGRVLAGSESITGAQSSMLQVGNFQVASTGWYQWRALSPDGIVSLESEPAWYGIATTWSSWLEAAGLTGADALPMNDFDGNGLPLLLEFALGYPPGGTWPSLDRVDGMIRTLRPLALSGVDLEIEVSTDLRTWMAVPWEPPQGDDFFNDSHAVWRADIRSATIGDGAFWRLKGSLSED